LVTGESAGDAESCVDNGLHQRSAVNPGGVIDHVRLSRVECHFCALHAWQGRQNRCTLLTQPPQVMPVTVKMISFMLSPGEVSGCNFIPAQKQKPAV